MIDISGQSIHLLSGKRFFLEKWTRRSDNLILSF